MDDHVAKFASQADDSEHLAGQETLLGPTALGFIQEETYFIEDCDMTGLPQNWESVQTPLDVDHEAHAKRRRVSYDCHLCGTSYTERRTLLRHWRTPAHCERAGLPIVNFPCKLCRTSFSRLDLMHRHEMEVHRGVRRSILRNEDKTPHSSQQVVVSKAGESAMLSKLASSNAFGPDISPNNDLPCRGIFITNPIQRQPASYENPPLSGLDQKIDLQLSSCSSSTSGVEISSKEEESSISEQSKHTLEDIETAYCNTVESGLDEITEAASVMSIAETSSIKSSNSFGWSFRGKLRELVSFKRNPRPNALLAIAPCPLCNRELGQTSADVKKHIDRHFRELSDTTESSPQRCDFCEITFVNRNDLKWHMRLADSHQTCGFGFAHRLRCTGHHPPSRGAVNTHLLLTTIEEPDPLNADHRAFLEQLRNWETAQLAEYRRYIDEHASGRTQTNSPHYGEVSASQYRRSTGSVQSTFSYLTTLSCPGQNGVRAYRSRDRPCDLQENDGHNQQLKEASLRLAIRCSDIVRAKEIFSELDPVRSIVDVADDVEEEVKRALASLNIDMLDALLQLWSDFGLENYRGFQLRDGILSVVRHRTRHGLGKAEMARLAKCLNVLENNVVNISPYTLVKALGSKLFWDLSLLNPELRLGDGITPLMYFAEIGELDSVNILIKAGADVNARIERGARKGKTALMLSGLSAEIFQRLVSAGANIHSQDEYGRTSLMYAALDASETSLRALVDHGSDLEARDHTGATALLLALTKGLGTDNKNSVIKYLLEAGANVTVKDKSGSSPLYFAITFRSSAIVQAFIEAGANVNETCTDGDTPLLYAAGRSSSDVVTALLNAGAKPLLVNASGETPLSRAAFWSNFEVLTTLLKYYASANASNDDGTSDENPDPLRARNMIFSEVPSLTSALEARDLEGRTPLFQAALYGSHNVVQLLLEHGANAQAIDNEAVTPLVYLFSHRHRGLPGDPRALNAIALIKAGATIEETQKSLVLPCWVGRKCGGCFPPLDICITDVNGDSILSDFFRREGI